jgi:hypothetical protein
MLDLKHTNAKFVFPGRCPVVPNHGGDGRCLCVLVCVGLAVCLRMSQSRGEEMGLCIVSLQYNVNNASSGRTEKRVSLNGKKVGTEA